MKGKKEGGEIKGREGRKENREKRRGEKKEREKKTEFHSRARTRNLPLCSCQPPMATAWRVDSYVCTIHVYIANFDSDDLTVAALAAVAPPISAGSGTKSACIL